MKATFKLEKFTHKCTDNLSLMLFCNSTISAISASFKEIFLEIFGTQTPFEQTIDPYNIQVYDVVWIQFSNAEGWFIPTEEIIQGIKSGKYPLKHEYREIIKIIQEKTKERNNNQLAEVQYFSNGSCCVKISGINGNSGWHVIMDIEEWHKAMMESTKETNS